jgi:hypothetical protein
MSREIKLYRKSSNIGIFFNEPVFMCSIKSEELEHFSHFPSSDHEDIYCYENGCYIKLFSVIRKYKLEKL